MKRILLSLLAFALASFSLHAQFALIGSERSSIKWEQIKSPSYKVIYPVGMDSVGRVYSDLLEYYRPLVGRSAGFFPNQKYLTPMPVVLHPFYNEANGAVVWAPRRMALFTYPDAYWFLSAMPWHKMLAIHENRHVAQMQFSRTGTWETASYLFGEISSLYVQSLYGEAAMFEGDAVVAETALTDAGRGRSGDFLSYIRMSYDQGDMRNWYRWRYGSLTRYTPDHYRIGYMTVAGMRYRYDAPMFMRTYLTRATSLFGFGAMRKSMAMYSNKNLRRTWNDISGSFQEIWEADDSLRRPFQELTPIVDSRRRYTTYYGTVQASDGSLYSARAALDKATELVRILPSGRVQSVRPFSLDSRLVYSSASDCIYWAESVPDIRWELEGTSRIRSMDLSSSSVQDFTVSGRYVNPSVSADGSLLAAVEYPILGGSRVVVFDVLSRREVMSFAAPFELQLIDVAFKDESSLFLTAVSDDGAGLYLLADGKLSVLEPPVPVKIADLTVKDGVLYFCSDRTGTSEIYSWTDGQLLQLTNTAYGASAPFFKDGALAFSALLPQGRTPVVADSLLARPVSMADRAVYPIADVLTAQEKELPIPEVKEYEPKVKHYSKALNALHVHSWVPMYINYDSFSASRGDYFYESGCLGGTVFFQNLTGNLSGSLGVSWHTDMVDTTKTRAGFHARVKYSGQYPVFDFALDVGDRNRAKIGYAYVMDSDSVYVKSDPMMVGTYIGGAAGVSVPLNFSSGGYDRMVKPYAKLTMSNDVFGEAFGFCKQDGTQVGYTDLATGEHGRWFHPNWFYRVGVEAWSKRDVALSALMPKFGIGGDIAYGSSAFGPSVFMSLYGYLPGLTGMQGMKLSLDAQSALVYDGHLFMPDGGSKGYMLPINPWAYGFEDLSPRGFDNTSIPAVLNLLSPFALRLSFDYAIPFLSVDYAPGSAFYLRNFELNPFADCTLFSVNDRDMLYSAGADLILRFEKLLFISNTLRLGLRTAYLGGSKSIMDGLNLSRPLYFGFVAGTEF